MRKIPLNSDITFQRVKLSGVLRTLSEFHVGSGQIRSGTSQDIQSINAYVADSAGRPFIPGSTLRGFLRAQFIPGRQVDFLFGHAGNSNDVQDTGNMGLVKAFDCPMTNGFEQFVNTYASIDSVNGSAKHHHLYSVDVVAEGTEFQVEIHINALGTGFNNEPINAILGALEQFNTAALGKGKSIGFGSMNWEPTSASYLSDADVISWLEEASPAPALARRYEKNTISLNSEKTTYFKACGSELRQSAWKSIDISIRNSTPILINNITAGANEISQLPNQQISKTLSAAFIAYTKCGKHIIPGSTLKGWFRAHSRRILLTITQGQDEQRVDELLSRMYGGHSDNGTESMIRFDNASCPEQVLQSQTFNAVDRFTGGVKTTALYKANAVAVGNHFEGRFQFNEARLDNWMRLLFVYCWNDAVVDDLVLGWGKAKGYGLSQLSGNLPKGHWILTNVCTLDDWHAELMAKLTMEVTDV